jgi:hypothetical protein
MADLAAESPGRRVAAVTGGAFERAVVRAVARAIGAPTPEVKERLRKRGEADLLEMVSSASPHLDAALDRLREVL